MSFDILNWLETHFEVKPAPGDDCSICCVFCDDKRFRLYVAHDGPKKGKMYCHNESKTYGFTQLYAITENVSYTEAEKVIKGDEIELPYKELSLELLKPPQKLIEKTEIPVVFPSHYVKLWGLDAQSWDKTVAPYCKKRYITQEICNDYFLGYCGAGDWKNRLIIPIYQDHKLVGYQGRAMYETEYMKYKFMAGFNSRNYLFNLDHVDGDTVILVEGVFDVFGMLRRGIKNVVASFGKHLSLHAMLKLYEKFKTVHVLWDRDAIPEIMQLADKIPPSINVLVSFLDAKDPDQASDKELYEALNNTYPFWQVQTELACNYLKINNL